MLDAQRYALAASYTLVSIGAGLGAVALATRTAPRRAA